MNKKWILSQCDLDLRSTVTNFNRVRASVVSNHLAKNLVQIAEIGASVWLEFCSQEYSDTHRQTHTQTNCSENITPPRFCGGVKTNKCSKHLWIRSIYISCKTVVSKTKQKKTKKKKKKNLTKNFKHIFGINLSRQKFISLNVTNF